MKMAANIVCPHCLRTVHAELPDGTWPGTSIVAKAVWASHPPAECLKLAVIAASEDDADDHVDDEPVESEREPALVE